MKEPGQITAEAAIIAARTHLGVDPVGGWDVVDETNRAYWADVEKGALQSVAARNPIQEIEGIAEYFRQREKFFDDFEIAARKDGELEGKAARVVRDMYRTVYTLSYEPVYLAEAHGLYHVVLNALKGNHGHN